MPKTVPDPEDIREVVFLEWVDPCIWNKGSFSLVEVAELKPHTLRSAGICICEDEESITIACDLDLADESMRFVQAILKRNIVRMRRWQWRETGGSQTDAPVPKQ